MKVHYCDHAATTNCHPDIWARMGVFASEEFGNPNSFHRLGRIAHAAVDEAREQIALQIGAFADELIFTSGGTESIHLALRGAAFANRHLGNEIVTTAIEHEAVLRTCESLQTSGFNKPRYLAPDEQGQISPEQVEEAIGDDTVLLSIIHANNEIGTIQDLAKIVKAARSKKPSILIHADAVQSVGHIPVNVQELDVDLLSFTAHKFYGPKGIGGVYVRRGVNLEADVAGGTQECGLRGGTLSVPLILGMAWALQAAVREMVTERAYWRRFRDHLEGAILKLVPDCRINGRMAERLDHFLHLSFRGIQGEDLVLLLDQRGVCASAGSACNSARGSTSHVLDALGIPRFWNRGSLRLTFGHGCRDIEPEWLAHQIAESVADLRSVYGVPPRRNFDRSLQMQ